MSPETPWLTVILPTKNEESAIEKVVTGIRKECSNNGLPVHVLVVDYKSKDKTVSIVKDLKCQLVETNIPGVGNAIKEGLSLVNTPYVALMDSDNTYFTGGLYNNLQYLLSGWDVVQGRRLPVTENAMTPTHVFGNKVLSKLASLLYRPTKDVCTGYWIFNTDKLKSLGIESKGFTLVAEFFVKSFKKGYKVKEVPIPYGVREHGSKSKLGYRHGLEIALYLIREKLSK